MLTCTIGRPPAAIVGRPLRGGLITTGLWRPSSICGPVLVILTCNIGSPPVTTAAFESFGGSITTGFCWPCWTCGPAGRGFTCTFGNAGPADTRGGLEAPMEALVTIALLRSTVVSDMMFLSFDSTNSCRSGLRLKSQLEDHGHLHFVAALVVHAEIHRAVWHFDTILVVGHEEVPHAVGDVRALPEADPADGERRLIVLMSHAPDEGCDIGEQRGLEDVAVVMIFDRTDGD